MQDFRSFAERGDTWLSSIICFAIKRVQSTGDLIAHKSSLIGYFGDTYRRISA